jgi:hypothetical protein
MEDPDEIDGDEVNELIHLTVRMEQQISSFQFTGDRVTGDIQSGGYAVEPGPEPEPGLAS